MILFIQYGIQHGIHGMKKHAKVTDGKKKDTFRCLCAACGWRSPVNVTIEVVMEVVMEVFVQV